MKNKPKSLYNQETFEVPSDVMGYGICISFSVFLLLFILLGGFLCV